MTLVGRTFSTPGELAAMESSSGYTDPVTAELEAYLAELRNQTSPFAEVEGFADRGSFTNDGETAEANSCEQSDSEVAGLEGTETDPGFEGSPFTPGQGPLAFFPAIWNLPMSFFTPEFWSQYAEVQETGESEMEITEVEIELDN